MDEHQALFDQFVRQTKKTLESHEKELGVEQQQDSSERPLNKSSNGVSNDMVWQLLD
jgi:hypothetical protein